MRRQPVDLWSLLRSVVDHRELILRLAHREVTQRFQGSLLGVAWMVLTPLLTAAVFTFVFSAVFQTRWAGATPTGPFHFAILLLVGMAVRGAFASGTQENQIQHHWIHEALMVKIQPRHHTGTLLNIQSSEKALLHGPDGVA